MSVIDLVGRAIHNSRRVGGPWGPPCGYSTTTFNNMDWNVVEYDDNSMEEYACLCKSMAQQLLEELVKL